MVRVLVLLFLRHSADYRWGNLPQEIFCTKSVSSASFNWRGLSITIQVLHHLVLMFCSIFRTFLFERRNDLFASRLSFTIVSAERRPLSSPSSSFTVASIYSTCWMHVHASWVVAKVSFEHWFVCDDSHSISYAKICFEPCLFLTSKLYCCMPVTVFGLMAAALCQTVRNP